MATCASCFREMAHVRVDLGSGPELWVHRRCLEDWISAPDGSWMTDGSVIWASWLSGNMARLVRARDYWWFQVFNSWGVVGNGRGCSLLDAQEKSERMAQ